MDDILGISPEEWTRKPETHNVAINEFGDRVKCGIWELLGDDTLFNQLEDDYVCTRDFYDFIDLDDGKLGVVIADVGDKGAGAALYMAMSRTLIRTYAGENQLPPEQVLHHVNRRILADTQRGIFLTVVFGILDPDQHSFTYVNAGHNPPLHLRRDENQVGMTELEKTETP